MRILDLSLPIIDHFRWCCTLEHTHSFERGDSFQTSALHMSCHAFTHVDAPVHRRLGGADIDQMPLSTWTGEAAVVDVTDVEANAPISAALLKERAPRLVENDLVLVKTCWDRTVSIDSPDYWLTSPYVTRDAAQWLHGQGVRGVGFDFPQDWGIRGLVAGEAPDTEHFATHDILLAQGVGLVEYLTGLHQIERDRVFFMAAPLRLTDADGSPVRAMAVEPSPVEGG